MRTPTHIHQHTHGRAHTSRARQALQGWVLWNGIHETPRAYMWGRIWHYFGVFQVDPGAVTLYGLFAVHMNEIEAPIWFGWGDCRLTRHSRTKKAGARLLTPDLVAKSRGITAITRINSQANTEDIQTEGAWSISIGVKSNQRNTGQMPRNTGN